MFCSVLYCFPLFCSVLQCSAVSRSVLQCFILFRTVSYCSAVFCSVLQYPATFCSVFHCFALFPTVLQCSAMFCIVPLYVQYPCSKAIFTSMIFFVFFSGSGFPWDIGLKREILLISNVLLEMIRLLLELETWENLFVPRVVSETLKNIISSSLCARI